jgi:hypothetical protein
VYSSSKLPAAQTCAPQDQTSKIAFSYGAGMRSETISLHNSNS